MDGWAVLAGEDLATAASVAGEDLGLDLPAIVKAGLHDTEVANQEFGGACYIGDSLPVVLYLCTKYAPAKPDLQQCLACVECCDGTTHSSV